MDNSKPTYTQDEINEILKRALEQQAVRERVLSHDELLEIAAEAGIDRESMDRAMAELAQEHTRELARQGEATEIAAERRVQVKRFTASLTSHAVLNAFLYVICTRFTGGNWYVWPILGSGALLALQLRHVLFPYEKVQRRRKEEEKQRERERKRAERAEWQKRIFGDGSQIAEQVKGFETVVEAGVSALVAIAERKLSEHKSREESSRRNKGR
jgi:hypothetical protein